MMAAIRFNSNRDVVIWALCFASAITLTWLGQGKWRWVGAILIGATLWLPAQDAANATTKVEGGPATVANHRWCSWFRVKEQDYGLFDNLLWDLQEKVTWCHNRTETRVNWLRRTWGQTSPGLGWTIQGHVLSGSRARDYSWYSRRVSADFDGWAGPVTVSCQPFVRIKVYDRSGRVDYDTGKGC